MSLAGERATGFDRAGIFKAGVVVLAFGLFGAVLGRALDPSADGTFLAQTGGGSAGGNSGGNSGNGNSGSGQGGGSGSGAGAEAGGSGSGSGNGGGGGTGTGTGGTGGGAAAAADDGSSGFSGGSGSSGGSGGSEDHDEDGTTPGGGTSPGGGTTASTTTVPVTESTIPANLPPEAKPTRPVDCPAGGPGSPQGRRVSCYEVVGNPEGEIRVVAVPGIPVPLVLPTPLIVPCSPAGASVPPTS